LRTGILSAPARLTLSAAPFLFGLLLDGIGLLPALLTAGLNLAPFAPCASSARGTHRRDSPFPSPAIYRLRNDSSAQEARGTMSAAKGARPKWAAEIEDPLSIPPALLERLRAAPSVTARQTAGERANLLESGTLAFRRRRRRGLEILLVSKRRAKKWGIPKGKLVPHLSFAENAAKEAFEEAGVIGRMFPHPVAAFMPRRRPKTDSRQW
jgi:hypothetical protein